MYMTGRIIAVPKDSIFSLLRRRLRLGRLSVKIWLPQLRTVPVQQWLVTQILLNWSSATGVSFYILIDVRLSLS